METDIQWRDKMRKLSADTETSPPPCCLTQVFSCGGALASYTASINSLRHPLYEREYAEKSEAEKGHRQTVELLAAGKLKLQP